MRKLFIILSTIFIVTTGCGDDDLVVYEVVETKVDNATFFFGEWKSLKKSFIYGSELTINKDGSFNFSYGACESGGYSIGRWEIENNEIILNSDSIDECLSLSEFGVYWVEIISDTTIYKKPKSTIDGCEPNIIYEDYVWFSNERFKITNDTIIHLNPKDTVELECQDKFYRLKK
jgi:hypothetical protein